MSSKLDRGPRELHMLGPKSSLKGRHAGVVLSRATTPFADLIELDLEVDIQLCLAIDWIK